jgi:hypothetical protein
MRGVLSACAGFTLSPAFGGEAKWVLADRNRPALSPMSEAANRKFPEHSVIARVGLDPETRKCREVGLVSAGVWPRATWP